MKNSFFSRFTPKEPKFFPLLKQLSEILLSSSALLIEILGHDSPEKRAEDYKRIKDLEREGDKLTNLILDELGTTFITPFDREDIHDLASGMDDVIDGINSCAKRITIYNPHPISDKGKELGHMVQQEAALIGQAMDELEAFRKSPDKLRAYCNQLHDIENRADDIYEFFITRLFEEEKDCIELIKIKEIMYELEKTTDAAEHVGKILRSLIVKYALTNGRMELLVIIIVLALIFDYINGFHDAANSIATIVSTKVLTPFQAVIWAAFFNFVAFFIAKCVIGGFGIANTVSKTVMEPYITLPIILAGVIAAIAWNLFTWWKGIPSSSSHTLIGGFAGAAIMAHGFEAIQLSIILKIAAFIFLAPLIGMVVAFGFTLLVLYICRRAHPHTAEVWFKKLQLVSSALFSIGHGLNDSQKVMGIIAAAMIAGHSEGLGMGINSIDDLPDWVAFSCFTAISLGTMSGGWKIVKTMGTKITKVTPLEGVIAETAGAFTLYLTEYLKIPVSTTHTITGAIIGVGATKRLSAVRWGVTKSLMTAWVLTIPVSALLAAGIYCIVSLF